MTDDPNDDYDSPWKAALERYLPDCLALLFPRVHGGIDWTRGYSFLDKELQQVVRDAALGRRLADKLVRVVGRDGREDWLLVHLEVEGSADADLPERLFVYNYRIFDRYRRPVVSLAVLTDERPGFRPQHFGWRRLGCAVGIRFPVAKLADWRARWDELAASTNPFAVLVQAHLRTQDTRHAPAERYQAKLSLAKGLYRHGWARADVLELFRCIDWMLRLPDELETQLWSEIRTYEEQSRMPYVTSVERIGIRKGLQQGIEQGLQQGLQEGLQRQRNMLLRMADRRFGAALAARASPLLAQVDDPATLADLAAALIDAGTGDDWLAVLATAVG